MNGQLSVEPATVALTLAQARQLHPGQELHYTGPSGKYPFGHPCSRTVGPRGGVTESVIRVRVTSVKTWKRDPSRIEVRVKHGLYQHATYGRFDVESGYLHLADDCPIGVRY